MQRRLFIDKENKIASVVTTFGRGYKVRREEKTFSFSKSSEIYGMDDQITYMKEVFKPEETIFCEL